MPITFEIVIDKYDENKYARRDLSITFKRVKTKMIDFNKRQTRYSLKRHWGNRENIW